MNETRSICEHSELHEEQGFMHCNRLAETTVHRGNEEKKVCEKHAEELTSDEFILNWTRVV